jgi:hypothetical protein
MSSIGHNSFRKAARETEMGKGNLCPTLAVAMLGLTAGGTALAADAPTGGQPGTRAFVATGLFLSGGTDAKSDAPRSPGNFEVYLSMLPPAERAELSSPGKRRDLQKRMWDQFGFRRLSLWPGDFGGRSQVAKLPPDVKLHQKPTPEQLRAIAALNGFPKDRGSLAYQNQTIAYSSCTNPYDFPALAKGYVPYAGKVSYGMNLDGKVGAKDFTGPDGEKGIDNQLWRAIGAYKQSQEMNDPAVREKVMLSARAPMLIEVSGIDDTVNDPDVTVRVLTGADSLVRDGSGKPLARASFTLDPDPALVNVTHGRIVNGVLTTDPIDLRFVFREQIVDNTRLVRGAVIKATFTPDGNLDGGVFGYTTLTSFYDMIEQMTQDGADNVGMSCVGVRMAIDRFADGYRDPKTGRFTAISSAMKFHAVPAFVIDPAMRTADSNSSQMEAAR